MKQPTTIHLRAMEPEDLELLYRIENDQQLWNIGVTNVPYSRYVLRDFIANSSGDIYVDRQVRLIIENAKNETVGLVDIVNFDAAHRRAELGMVILNEYRRHGYAQQTMREIEKYAQDILHLHQLFVMIAADNIPCLCLFNKMGYMQTAELKEWLFDGHSYHDVMLFQIFFEKKQ